MVRKARARRSVNEQGVKKHKILSRSIQKNIFERIEKLLPKKYVVSLYKLSEYFFIHIIQICCKLSLIRLSIDSQGQLRVGKSRRELLAHYSVLIVQIMRMLHMFVATGNQALSGLMDLTTFLCISSLLSYAVGFSMSSSLLFRPHDTAQLFNATPLMLTLFPKANKVTTTMFQNAKTSIIITVLGILTCGIALLISSFGFLVDQFPISLYHIAETMVGRPPFLPYLFWKVLIWPMELLTYLHTMILASFSSMMLLTLPNIMLTCTKDTRKMRVSSCESWLELRAKYFKLQVYVCLVNVWVKFLIVPTIFSVSSSIIIALYVTFRHIDIPIFIYLQFPLVGVALFILLFWFSFEVLGFIQSTEAIVGKLNSKGAAYVLQLPPQQRHFLTKYGKATRRAVFDVGDFVDYSINVPISIWDEILNQG